MIELKSGCGLGLVAPELFSATISILSFAQLWLYIWQICVTEQTGAPIQLSQWVGLTEQYCTKETLRPRQIWISVSSALDWGTMQREWAWYRPEGGSHRLSIPAVSLIQDRLTRQVCSVLVQLNVRRSILYLPTLLQLYRPQEGQLHSLQGLAGCLLS